MFCAADVLAPTDGDEGGQVLHQHLPPINVFPVQAPPPPSASGLDFEVEYHPHDCHTKEGGQKQGKRDARTVFSITATVGGIVASSPSV